MQKRRFRLRFLDHVHHLPKADRVLIGRGDTCHVHLDGDLVSREHASLQLSDEKVVLRDLGSRNGVYVNGARVEGSAELQDGDQIKIAYFDLTFEAVPVYHSAPATLELVHCATCGSLLTGEMRFCVSCGGEVSPDRRRSMCPKCRGLITPFMHFCGMCGFRLLEPDDGSVGDP